MRFIPIYQKLNGKVCFIHYGSSRFPLTSRDLYKILCGKSDLHFWNFKNPLIVDFQNFMENNSEKLNIVECSYFGGK